jgi:hypothetical protein
MKYVVSLKYPIPKRNEAGTVLARPTLSLRPTGILGMAVVFNRSGVIDTVGPKSAPNRLHLP